MRRSQRAQAIVEAAVIFPALLALAIGAPDPEDLYPTLGDLLIDVASGSRALATRDAIIADGR